MSYVRQGVSAAIHTGPVCERRSIMRSSLTRTDTSRRGLINLRCKASGPGSVVRVHPALHA